MIMKIMRGRWNRFGVLWRIKLRKLKNSERIWRLLRFKTMKRIQKKTKK